MSEKSAVMSEVAGRSPGWASIGAGEGLLLVHPTTNTNSIAHPERAKEPDRLSGLPDRALINRSMKELLRAPHARCEDAPHFYDQGGLADFRSWALARSRRHSVQPENSRTCPARGRGLARTGAPPLPDPVR